MVHTTLTSDFRFSTRSERRLNRWASHLYQVTINGEDGEYLSYEIEADSYSEASAKAEMLAADAMVDISYIEAFLLH